MSLILELFHAFQTCASAYTGLLSAMAIYNLHQREEQTERLAGWSGTAAHQLHKTRTTQASGAAATVSSLVSSVILAVSVSSGQSRMPLLLSAANAGGLALAYRHIRNFWQDKAKVPFLSDYNEGVTASNQLLQALGGLAISWAASTAVYVWRTIVF